MRTASRSAVLLAASLLILGQSRGLSQPKGAGQPAGSIPVAACPTSPSQDSGASTAVCAPATLERMEKQMLDLVNHDRADAASFAETHGQAQRLKWNERLAAVARAHSEDMLVRRYFNHVDPDGLSPSMRVTRAGIDWQAQGENIALHYGVAQAESAFMDEPAFQHNHRSNILSPKYTEIGIGIVRGPDGMYYITQEFVGDPDDSPSMMASARVNEVAHVPGASPGTPAH